MFGENPHFSVKYPFAETYPQQQLLVAGYSLMA